MSQYPIILIPSSIQNTQTVLPLIKTKEEFAGSEPKQPKKPKKFYGKATAILSFIAVLAGGFTSNWLSLPILPCIVFFLLLVVSRVIYFFQSYPNRLNQYDEDYKEYKNQLKLYREKLAQYANYVEQERTEEKVIICRKEQLKNVLERTESYDGENSEHPKGPKELKLYSALKRYFPNKIYTRLRVQNPEFSQGYYYSPDSAYIDRVSNLHIDIELDEPYTKNGKQPIHYIGITKDIKRNNHFNSRGWLVIRFSEEQVVCHVESCCKTVAQVIAEITQDNSILQKFNNENIPDLEFMKQWTYEEAIEMANNNYRDNYPCKFSKVVQLVTPYEPEIIFYSSIQDVPFTSKNARRVIRSGFNKWCKDNRVTNETVESAKIEYLNSINTGKIADWLAVEGNKEKAINKFLKDWTM